MPNEAFGRLNVKTAPFYLAFRNLSSIDSNHKKIRICVFQDKSGQRLDKYRRRKKTEIPTLLFLQMWKFNRNWRIILFWGVFSRAKWVKNPQFNFQCEIESSISPLLIPCCFFVGQMSCTIMRSIWWTKY